MLCLSPTRDCGSKRVKRGTLKQKWQTSIVERLTGACRCRPQHLEGSARQRGVGDSEKVARIEVGKGTSRAEKYLFARKRRSTVLVQVRPGLHVDEAIACQRRIAAPCGPNQIARRSCGTLETEAFYGRDSPCFFLRLSRSLKNCSLQKNLVASR